MNVHFRLRSLMLALLLAATVAGLGCNKNTEPGSPDASTPVDGAAANAPDPNAVTVESLRKIRTLAPDVLASLGPQTEFPTQWLYPNAFYAKIMFPGKAAASPAASQLDQLLKANSAALPFVNFCDDLETIYVSEKNSFISLTDPASGNVLTTEFPLPARAVYLRSQQAIDPQQFTEFAFAGIPADQIKEETLGSLNVRTTRQSIMVPLDQEQQKMGKANDVTVALAFPDANSALMVTGSPDDVQEFFTAGPDASARGPLAQYMAHTSLDNVDFLFLYDYNHPLAAMVPNIFPDQFGQEVVTAGDLVALGVNSRATDGSDIVTLTLLASDTEKGNKAQTALGATLMFLAEEAKKVAAMPNAGAGAAMLTGLDEVLKKVQTEVQGTRLIARVPWSQATADFLVGSVEKLNESRVQAERMARYNGIAQQLGMLAGAMTAAYGKNNVYPSDILGADGTPLLSWRVALLPQFGPEGEALYKEFKLDEPWNGPNNIKLLDKIPGIYTCILDPAMKTKTTFQRFNSANTPFGQHADGLKTQQLANPGKTFMIVSTAPSNAVEWTQPESLILDESNPDSLVTIFGDYVAAVPFMGNVFLAPLSGKPEGLQTLIGWITGNLPAESEATPSAAPAESDQTPAAAETPAAEPVMPTEPVMPAEPTAEPAPAP
ncbi:MAG: hypothetical protein Q4G68_08110 [Planctomycetia bacterium]|nr:hypothetical protein [Planctomycetia bacterium]